MQNGKYLRPGTDKGRPKKDGSRMPRRERGQSQSDSRVQDNAGVFESPIASVAPIPMPYTRPEPVKVATPDLIITGEAPETTENMVDMVFQKIGGHEIISLSRSENVNGQNVRYQPIKNIQDISAQYNSKNIIPMPTASTSYNSSFAINLASKIPEKGLWFSGVYSEEGPNGNIYVVPSETENGPAKLVIEAVNIASNQRIQVEIVKSSDVFNDTIS